MSEPTEKPQEAKDFFALTERILLAGIGAVALAHDEVEAFVRRLVERGELARDQGRDLLQKVREKRGGRLEKVREHLREHLDEALERLDLPRRSDLEALQTRLDRLTEQVEKLLAQE